MQSKSQKSALILLVFKRRKYSFYFLYFKITNSYKAWLFKVCIITCIINKEVLSSSSLVLTCTLRWVSNLNILFAIKEEKVLCYFLKGWEGWRKKGYPEIFSDPLLSDATRDFNILKPSGWFLRPPFSCQNQYSGKLPVEFS